MTCVRLSTLSSNVSPRLFHFNYPVTTVEPHRLPRHFSRHFSLRAVNQVGFVRAEVVPTQ